jgi:hypothetical protein
MIYEVKASASIIIQIIIYIYIYIFGPQRKQTKVYIHNIIHMNVCLDIFSVIDRLLNYLQMQYALIKWLIIISLPIYIYINVLHKKKKGRLFDKIM